MGIGVSVIVIIPDQLDTCPKANPMIDLVSVIVIIPDQLDKNLPYMKYGK